MRADYQKFAEITESGRFATTVAMSFLAPKRQLSLSNAGHPAPMWYRASDQRWHVLGVDPEDSESKAEERGVGPLFIV